jgi:hypothetical protein
MLNTSIVNLTLAFVQIFRSLSTLFMIFLKTYLKIKLPAIQRIPMIPGSPETKMMIPDNSTKETKFSIRQESLEGYRSMTEQSACIMLESPAAEMFLLVMGEQRIVFLRMALAARRYIFRPALFCWISP